MKGKPYGRGALWQGKPDKKRSLMAMAPHGRRSHMAGDPHEKQQAPCKGNIMEGKSHGMVSLMER